MHVRARSVDVDMNEMAEFIRIMKSYNYTVRKFLAELQQPCDKLLRMCIWLDVNLPCNELFHVSDTTEGLCCSFNHRSHDA